MSNRRVRWGIAILAAASIYYGAAKVGFALAFVHGTVSAVWPPTGFALALLLIAGPRMWPAILLGEFVADFANGTPLLVSLAFAVGSTCEALAGYGLLQFAHFRPTLERVRDVFALLGLAALFSTIVSATIGTGALLVAGTISAADAWGTWHVWWLGDVTGDVIVAPLLMVLATTRLHRPHGWRAAEAASFGLVLAAIAAVAHALTLGIAYLVLPVLIWAALRFRQQGAVIANAVLAGVGVIAAAGAGSELARVSLVERVLFTQNFVAVGAITTLVLAAMIAERDRAAVAMERSEAAANGMVQERTALGLIATAIAGEMEPERVFALIAEHAGRLLGAADAAVIRTEGAPTMTVAATWGRDDAAHAVGGQRIAAPIRVGGQIWGTVVARAAAATTLPDAGEQLLARLADLASMAIVNAEARHRLLTEATTDALTGLVNQRVFQRQLTDETARFFRYHRPFAVALVDVDDFKAINDTAGHLAGDRVLTEVARRVTAVMRGEALVARLGGDEFALLLPECDEMQAYAAAERARLAVSANPVAHCGRVTVSVGVADAGQAEDGEQLVALADVALYAAKMEGRDSCVRYSPALVPNLSGAAPSQNVPRVRTLADLLSLAHSIDARDHETVEHSRRVAELATALARARHWAPQATDMLRQAALVHDVGKSGVPDSILLARRRLEPDEYELVKRHAELGAELAADILSDDQVRWIRWHHERADGRGYPDGLTAEQIPEGAKLLAIADAWDAMTTGRSYSSAKPIGAALAECRHLAGHQFAPEAVAALLAVEERILLAA